MTTEGSSGVQRESIVRTALLCVAAATTIALLVLIWIGTYSRLVADDFCTGADVMQHGIAGAVWHWYRTWSGRFSYHIVTAIAGAAGPLSARILPGLTILGLAGSTIFAAKRVTRARWLAAVALGLVLTWSILGCAPDIFQVLFWASGVTTYSIPLILIAVWIGIALRADGARVPMSAHALLFLAAGFSETVTAVLAAAVALALASWPERRRALAGGLVAAIAGAILMLAAPGNADRASRFERPEAAGPSMVGLDATEFLQVEALIAGMSMLLVFSVAASAGSRDVATAPLRGRAIAATVVAVFWGIAVPLLMARVVMAIPAPLRSLEPTHALLAGTFAMAGWQVGRRWSRASSVAAVAMLLLVIPLLRDLRELTSMAGGVAVFAREWDAMDESLRTRTAEPAVVVPAPARVGRLDFVNPSPAHWANRCMARYYGIGQIAGESGPARQGTTP